jgi:hypothetical protein
MSSLSSQQINQSYQGLLKLADSTTGITANLQAIQDGLGGDTGVKLAQGGFLSSPSFVSVKPVQKYTSGPGIATGIGTGLPSGSNNKYVGTYFIENNSMTSYSGITFRVGTVTSTADVINFAFYTVENTPEYGIAPKDLIMSGITLDAADLGVVGLITKSLPSPLTFTEPGVYCLLMYADNPTSVTPTARITAPADIFAITVALGNLYGYRISVDGNGAQNVWVGANTEAASCLYNTLGPGFPASFTPSTIAATAQTSILSVGGFLLT